METSFFGLGYEFDGGADPGVAINTNGVVVEVHKNEGGTSLYARTGKINKAQILWNDMGSGRKSYTGGRQPAVALNSRGDVVEVHKREVGDKIFSMYGTLSGTGISWGTSKDYDSDGHDPSVAVNYNRQVVTFYVQDNDDLKYRRGSLDTADKEVDWRGEQDFGTNGQFPKVAMNDNGWVVVTYQKVIDGRWKAVYRVGQLSTNLDLISWGTEYQFPDLDATRPCVALTNEGYVVAIYNQGSTINLIQVTGHLADKTIRVETRAYFDDGKHSSVAAAGKIAVRIAQGELVDRLWYSTSLITDRANWMRDRLPQLGAKKMKQLFIPGSHDAAMYTGGFSTLGKTQELSIYDQLLSGQRFFDLRVEWNDPYFDLHHNGINGPRLSDVLNQIARFCLEGHRELVILDFSHFSHFGETSDPTIYNKFISEVINTLGTWMYKNKPSDRRLADVTLSEYISNGPALVVVVDEAWPVLYPQPGAWVFRNSESEQAAEGDLRVFDQYAKDMNYEDVKKDQTDKYNKYNGYCDPKTSVPCDLFLLSWTCTSPVGAGVWQVSKNVNRHLGDYMVHLKTPNPYGLYPNIVYVDYCEFARAADVVLYANGTPLAATAKLDIMKSESAEAEAQPPMYDISTLPDDVSPERSSE